MDLDQQRIEEILRSVQQRVDPSGLAIQLDWEFIEPLYVNAYASAEMEADMLENDLSPFELNIVAIDRVNRAVMAIFYPAPIKVPVA